MDVDVQGVINGLKTRIAEDAVTIAVLNTRITALEEVAE